MNITSPDDNSTYVMTGNEVDVPYTFTGTSLSPAAALTPVDGHPWTAYRWHLRPDAYGNLTCNATGTMAFTSAGSHQLLVTCTDDYGTATDSENFTVTLQTVNPPPTVVINTPAPNAIFTYTTGGPALSVPFTFTGSSMGGPITSLTATMDGNPVTFTTSGLNTLTANGATNLSFNSAGNHTLQVTATNNGGTASTTEIITVVSQSPTTSTLTVAINKPLPNSTYAISTNGGSVSIADAFTAKSTNASGVTSLNVTVNGNPVVVTPTAFGQPTVTASGTLVISTPGVYTIGVSATDAVNTATTSENITVTAPTACPKITV